LRLTYDYKKLLEPFGYGEEFIRLNFEALEAYSACSNAEEVFAHQQSLLESANNSKIEKEKKKEKERCRSII
jgi:ribosome biogenesis protein Tsr3